MLKILRLNILQRIGLGLKVSTSSNDVINKSILPIYARLNDGTHSYNYETTRFGFFGSLGLGKPYLTPFQNYKQYYSAVPYFADVVDMLSDIYSSMEIREVNVDTNEIVENSPIIDLLNNPNNFQTKEEFLKEDCINTIITGIGVQYSNSFLNGNIKVFNQLFNLNYNNLAFPKIKDPYALTRKDLSSIIIKEKLSATNIKDRRLQELAIVYDIGKNGTYGNEGYNQECFFNPISRICSIISSLHIMMNTEDSMAYLSDSPIDGIVSKNHVNGELPELGGAEKMDIETKLSGKGKYGSKGNKRKIIATNEDLKYQEIGKDPSKLRMVEFQNNAKENIRSRMNIPRDMSDAVSGSNRGSTYENKQTAEAFLINSVVKGMAEKRMSSYENRLEGYFNERRTKLDVSFDHLPSIEAFNSDSYYAGLDKKMDAFIKAQEAYEKAVLLGDTKSYKEFMSNLGFDDLL